MSRQKELTDDKCRAGSLDVVKAQELGVFPGPAYGALKAGEAVQAEGGCFCRPFLLACPIAPPPPHTFPPTAPPHFSF